MRNTPRTVVCAQATAYSQKFDWIERMDTMSAVTGVANYKFDQVETLVFAGGGNRCWWQAGLLTQLFDSGFKRPQRFVGTSGGAAVAAALLTHGAQHALETCITAYAGNRSIFDFSRRPKLRFAHTTIYPTWIASFFNAESFSKFRASTTTLTVAVTRPTRLLASAAPHSWERLHISSKSTGQRACTRSCPGG